MDVDLMTRYRRRGFDLNPLCPEQPTREYYLRTHGNLAEWELDLLRSDLHESVEIHEDATKYVICQYCGQRLVQVDRELFATSEHLIQEEEEPW